MNFALSTGLLWTLLLQATPIIHVTRSGDKFSSETVGSASLSNITVISFGYHEGVVPKWAHKAFLAHKNWDRFSCGFELLTVFVASSVLEGGDRRWTADATLFDSTSQLIGKFSCIGAPPYGHPYPIREPLIPRSQALFCDVDVDDVDTCTALKATVSLIKLTMTSGNTKGCSTEFEPRIPAAVNSNIDRPSRQMVICVCPLPQMDKEMKAKLQLWIAYHLELGLDIVVSVESTDLLSEMPTKLLLDERLVIYAPGILTGVNYYQHVGYQRRGKYRAHFDTDKTLTTTFMRFQSRIVRQTEIAFVMDFDEFLFAPKAPLISNLKVVSTEMNWLSRCNKMKSTNSSLSKVAGLKMIVNGLLDPDTDAKAIVLMPNINPDINTISKLPADISYTWSPIELDAMRAQGNYIRKLVLEKYACALDQSIYGYQIELPRSDAANEYFTSTCISDLLSNGTYSLHPCIEYMDLLQKGTARKKSFKNKVLNIGQPCPGDMIHTSCARRIKFGKHAYGLSCSCDIYIQDELVLLHHWFRGISPKLIRHLVCSKASPRPLDMNTLEAYHKSYYNESIDIALNQPETRSRCQSKL